jgi:hypothetical protein
VCDAQFHATCDWLVSSAFLSISTCGGDTAVIRTIRHGGPAAGADHERDFTFNIPFSRGDFGSKGVAEQKVFFADAKHHLGAVS